MRADGLAVFGGTTEGRVLAERLEREGFQGIVFVATEYGAGLLAGAGRNMRIRAGRLDRGEMEAVFSEEGIGLVIDAAHPYAVRLRANIRNACAARGIPLLRCLREAGAEENAPEGEEHLTGETFPAGKKTLAGERRILFPGMKEAAQWLAGTEGNILLTTGSRDLAMFSGVDRERLYVRVLPLEDSLKICRSLGYEGRHVIAMQGPFSEELNFALLKEFSCGILVTKDGGTQGGFEEKRRAAARAGAVLAVVERPKETGFSVDEIMERAREWRNHGKGQL